MPVAYEVRDGNKAFYNDKTIGEWLSTAINELVSKVDPVAIYVFGSVARGEEGPHSDLDLLVIFDKIRDDQVIDLMIEARRSITAPIPCDVLVSDLARFEFNKQRLWHIEHQIARSGLMAYEREPKIPKESYMNPPPPDEIADATEFLKRAKNDLLGAELFRDAGDKHNAGFHAQQACEKALKALLIALRHEPPRTHDLVELVDVLEELPGHHVNLFDKQALEALTPWALVGRYPGDIPDIANKPTPFLVNSAKSVVDTCEDLLSKMS